jgi:predicted flap endonuclease-1-like 5' DNA nuclease
MGLLSPSAKAQKPSTAAPKASDLKPEKTRRVDFVRASVAKPIIDDKGRLTGLPGALFDSKLHLAPRKGDFATESLYLVWKADELERHATGMAKRAVELRQEAERAKNAPDPAVRANLKRLQRLKDMQAALEEQLKKEGIAF